MSRKQLVILAVAFILIIVGTILGILNRRPEDNDNNQLPIQPPPTVPKINGYTPDVPRDVNLTIPNIEAPANPKAIKAKFKVFEMKINRNGYEPNILTVNVGDTVQIKMTSVDGDYDFSMPWTGHYQFIKNGETKTVGLSAETSGSYTFECRDHCPSGKIIKGSIIVLP